jgi:PAS domain S-box-containing protein
MSLQRKNPGFDAQPLSEQGALDRDRLWSLSQELMLVCDSGGVVAGANPSFGRILGWNESDLLGQRVVDFLHPDDMQRGIQALAGLTQGPHTLSFENRVRGADGTYRHIGWTAVYEDGRVFAVGRDMTDERELAKDYERIWNVSPVVKAVGTMRADLIAVNPSWTRLLGYTSEETVGRNILDFVAPEDREVGLEGLGKLFADEPIAEFACTFATKDGGRKRISWTAVPEDGTLYGFGRDVTAETEANKALAESLAERERIWNTTNDLMGIACLDGFLKSANPAWQRLLGYDDAQLLSRPLLDIIDPTDHVAAAAAMERLARGEHVDDVENRLIHKDGRKSLIAWSIEPMGDLFYMVGRNITQQRLVEEALRQSQKMEAVGQLTGGIAHDFNNLLQGITGSLDLLQRRLDQGRYAEAERFIASAATAANRAAALTHRLLAFSRRQPLHSKPVAANPLIVSMEDLLRRTLGEHVTLELRLAPDLRPTLCDRNQLENAILNLAINARDAMADGGRLTIETCNVELTQGDAASREIAAGSYVRIQVKDTGIGMSPVTRARAFEPFFTTKPMGQGTGLGLSMIYGFARQSDGHAEIDSESGAGTTFTLHLPACEGAVEEPGSARRPTPERLAGDGATVLIVEDQPIVRALVVEILIELGFRVIEASDGASGLEILHSSRQIDLLITDIGLPLLNGRQMVDAARDVRPGLKVLFMTGYAENASRSVGRLGAGMALITKPFTVDAVTSSVKKLLNDG